MAKQIVVRNYTRSSVDRMANLYTLTCQELQNTKTGELTERVMQVKHLGKGSDVRWNNSVMLIGEVITKAYRIGMKEVSLDTISQYVHHKVKFDKRDLDMWTIHAVWRSILNPVLWPDESNSIYQDLRSWMEDCIRTN